SAIVRWLHVVAGPACIGSSFYFITLDLNLKPHASQLDGINGQA
ncbi:MAG: urate hydroxylase PuuD, partial [Bradyrhizobiaceae bacterium]|nr:urate hydroxylase PuuD [Bradyrhizobiaceae bacterium]